MKKFLERSVILMLFLLAACGEERLYSQEELIQDPELVNKIVTKNKRNSTAVSAQNYQNAKDWFPEKFSKSQTIFGGMFQNSNEN